MSDSSSGVGKTRAHFFVPNCRTLRVAAGNTIADLARTAGVDRNTIDKIEHLKKGVTEEMANRVFNTLNGWHPSRKLDRKREITTTNQKIRLTGHSA